MSDNAQRWVIVVVYLAATVTMVGGLWAKLRNAKRGGLAVSFSQRCAHVGGALVCLFVATGSLGVIFGWDTFFRLSSLIVAGAFTVVGRGLEWREERKAGRRG